MGKKKGKDKNPKDDDDFELTVPRCRHLKKGSDQTLLKKVSPVCDWLSCDDCKHEDNKENIIVEVSQKNEEEEGEAVGMWMCLKCGHRGCGRNSENQHAIKHYETPRSEPHCLVVSLDNWSVWCYICDDEVQYSSTGHLSQLVSNLKKQTMSEATKGPQKRVKEEEPSTEAKPTTETLSAETEEKEKKLIQKTNGKKETMRKPQRSDSPDHSGVSVKGLSNLGNTCFFNAVIQNLSQTQLLRQTLHKVIEDQQSLTVRPTASVHLEPLTVQPELPGSLTVAMAQLLTEIQETKKSVVTPRELFTQVCKKAARFKGFQQQDSQELLRYLLDGMRAEELKRVSAGILEALKLSKKMADGEDVKTMVKAYEKNGLPKNFVDQVFGGEMTSTIMCQQCKTVSVVTEMFLDLSLPVADEAYRKKNQKKGVQKSSEEIQESRNSPSSTSGNEDISSGASSKYQQKKAKKQAKKQAKHQRRQQKIESQVTLDGLSSLSLSQSKETEEGGSQSEQDPEQACESPQNPISLDAIQVELEGDDDADSATERDSSAGNRFTVLSKEATSIVDQEEDPELVSGMEDVTLDEAFIVDSENTIEGMESEEEAPEVKEYMVTNQDPRLAFHTLATRTAPEKQECSVQSCLFQFTEVETLTQTNSLLCVTCSKQLPRTAEESHKKVYTDALKQMLISTPPPVLTLHLKRFQQNGYSICKVNRHVQFPVILDLAPFSAVTCKNIAGDSQILYNLYGIVEHSGTMRSGHYTAYVKVRPDSPKSSSNGFPAEGLGQQSKGSWFHISDTSVQPVSENKVQSCQAYLLFYERIL